MNVLRKVVLNEKILFLIILTNPFATKDDYKGLNVPSFTCSFREVLKNHSFSASKLITLCRISTKISKFVVLSRICCKKSNKQT